MSVPELRARIMELDTEINLQRELLKKLEHDKSLVQRQLNAVFDPMARLPLEICSEIFLQSLSPLPQPGASDVPTLLLNICNAWSAIALSTPDLWSAIQIEFPCTDGLARLLRIWFERAHNRPLSVLLHGDLTSWDRSFSAVIWRHGAQLKHLEIVDLDYYYEDDEDDERQVHFFAGTIAEPLSLLEHLTIRSPTPGDEILELLSLAPNLVVCALDYNLMHGSDTSENPVLNLSLRQLTFGDQSDWYSGDHCNDALLSRLSLPALKTLSLPMSCLSAGDFLRFMKRSTPPLQDLVMGWDYHVTDSIGLRECLDLIPSLARFDLRRPNALIMADLSAALADSPSLLPNLCSLTIQTFDRTLISDSSWRMLARAVSNRRIQFHVLGRFYPSLALPEDVLAAFQELVGDGIEIHIMDVIE
ncbi:hypothetical protein B0H12DRAFT_1236782 [Mycena haematopus]|nr:hypothetical protein B0H12DRAFT_1236782 [Mycena haematopus]